MCTNGPFVGRKSGRGVKKPNIHLHGGLDWCFNFLIRHSWHSAKLSVTFAFNIYSHFHKNDVLKRHFCSSSDIIGLWSRIGNFLTNSEFPFLKGRWDSVVGIVTRLQARHSEFKSRSMPNYFSLFQNVLNGSGLNPASYSVDIRVLSRQ